MQTPPPHLATKAQTTTSSATPWTHRSKVEAILPMAILALANTSPPPLKRQILDFIRFFVLILRNIPENRISESQICEPRSRERRYQRITTPLRFNDKECGRFEPICDHTQSPPNLPGRIRRTKVKLSFVNRSKELRR